MTITRSSIIIALMLIVCSGCAAILNPYDDEFQCPEGDKGLCTSMENAYKLSRSGQIPQSDNNADGQTGNKSVKSDGFELAKKRYQETLLNKLSETMEKPGSPNLVAPVPATIYLFGYTDQNNSFLSGRYLYIYVQDPEWKFSPFLTKSEER